MGIYWVLHNSCVFNCTCSCRAADRPQWRCDWFTLWVIALDWNMEDFSKTVCHHQHFEHQHMQANHLWLSLSEEVKHINIIFIKLFFLPNRLQSVWMYSNLFFNQSWTDCSSFLGESISQSVSQSDEVWMDGLMGSAAKEVSTNAARVAC